MHVWYLEKWRKYLSSIMEEYKTGLRIRYEKSVDPEIKALYTEFAKWLRREYCFPLRVNIYIKSSYKIKAMDGDSVEQPYYI